MPELKLTLCLLMLCLSQLIASSPVCQTHPLREGETTWLELDTQCNEERRACEQRHGISNIGNVVSEECWFRPIDDERQFFGPCPDTLRNSELFDVDSVEWVLANVLLRQYFWGKDRVTFYKASESASELQKILEMDSENHRAIEISLRHADQFKISVDRRLQLALRLPTPDPECIEDTWFYIGGLGSIIERIAVEAYASRGMSLQELVASDVKIRESIELVETAYLKTYESLDAYEKLPIAWAFVSEPFFGRVLSRLGNEARNKHLQFITEDLRSEFGVGGEGNRSVSLNMLCNDYAFELGLMKSCLELVTHHWGLDATTFDKPSDSVIEAATRLAIASSRTCDEPYFLELPQKTFRVVVESVHCDPELHAEVNSEINRLLERFENLNDYPELSVLRVYTKLTEESQQIFRNVIAADSKQIVHAVLIAKRLNQVGAVAEAELVLDASLKALKDEYDETFFECWFPRTDRFWSRSFDGVSNHLSLQGREWVSDAKDLIEAALAVQIDQGNIPFLEGAYISDPPTNWSNTNYCDLDGNSEDAVP